MQKKWRLLSTDRLWRRHITPEDVDSVYARCIEKLRQSISERKRMLPEGSARHAVLDRLESLADEALMEDLFSSAHPNPERIDCPLRDVLVALARRERPIGDPAYDHLAKCSPCWVEVRDLKQTADIDLHPPQPIART
jgi:hypothetical protein